MFEGVREVHDKAAGVLGKAPRTQEEVWEKVLGVIEGILGVLEQILQVPCILEEVLRVMEKSWGS